MPRAFDNQFDYVISVTAGLPHFRPQVDGDLVKDGVCSVFIAQKLGVSQPTASEHLKLLTQSGLVTPRRIKQWTFYKRNERRIREFKRGLRNV